ncbi:NAD(P)-dependent oxidoreductase [Aestuariispira insulae]|uniref:Lactate dehydrogenase-like 2-hydroxyacid dehydrogenase n=1 Tax=Aestuariispira insulae TaxID=1461337 RepID=A0A3D9HSE1_9PROT|nr:NAD(P)-dependent oxidoreductase [Aestuariispira insulae]RED52380.1 lactate dehydrogenase-like 2-hydroxyacid dehydrogenase [Aestuariispira insulae]
MATVEELKAQREASLQATAGGAPARTNNPFFGVGPITDMTLDEADARRLRFEFDAWLEANYPKLDDKGNKIGAFTATELGRSMHRGYPADKVLLDMMTEIHTYFEFPKKNKMAVGLGGGHSGFTVALLHMMNANDEGQKLYIDTPKPESDAGKAGGFFRQSWGAQIIEMHRFAEKGDESRLHFAEEEGSIPTAAELEAMGVSLFVGVGHETTGATTYAESEIRELLKWIDGDPANRHAVIDATSMLGSMPWAQEVVREAISKCCMFMPFQKAIGGVSGYFVISITPEALALIEKNAQDPAWSIPRQLKMAVPTDPKEPLSSKKTVELGPIFDPEKGAMLGGIINTFSTLAFAETAFCLQRSARMIGDVSALNARSIKNRDTVNEWIAKSDTLELGVANPEKRGAAVTLLKVTDDGIQDSDLHATIIAKSKQLLGYEGLTHPNGDFEPGLDVARYVNAFPGTPGDYRAWIGGIRPVEDVTALLENLAYAYHRAKIVVLEELLAAEGVTFEASAAAAGDKVRQDDADKAYKVLVADLVGLKFDANGKPDHSAVRAHVEAKGGVWHEGLAADGASLEKGKIHFFYQPDLSREEELLPITKDGQYDATIVAATFLPADSTFKHGGVRIGAGTGNMGSKSWGGGNGDGGEAPLMNTPSFNSRATAQMAMKGLLKVSPDLPVELMHERVVGGDFDTGKNLCEYPTEKVEGKKIAVIGYGNIGREVAKIAKSFNMKVAIYAREAHKDWIESEGFEWAATPVDAAKGADFISPHTGLGAFNAESGKFANDSIINDDVFNAMNDGAVVVNYDRGEVINIDALDRALESGKVRYAAIDADLFVNAETGELSGPMVPYRNIEPKHRGKLELLPHAAADTEHVSRVEGAKQAVDQIMDVIQYKSVTNLKGDLPEGYVNAGAKTVNGVGKVTTNGLASVAASGDAAELRKLAEDMAALWGALASTSDADRRANLLNRYGADLIKASNKYASLMEELGLQGPYGG